MSIAKLTSTPTKYIVCSNKTRDDWFELEPTSDGNNHFYKGVYGYTTIENNCFSCLCYSYHSSSSWKATNSFSVAKILSIINVNDDKHILVEEYRDPSKEYNEKYKYRFFKPATTYMFFTNNEIIKFGVEVYDKKNLSYAFDTAGNCYLIDYYITMKNIPEEHYENPYAYYHSKNDVAKAGFNNIKTIYFNKHKVNVTYSLTPFTDYIKMKRKTKCKHKTLDSSDDFLRVKYHDGTTTTFHDFNSFGEFIKSFGEKQGFVKMMVSTSYSIPFSLKGLYD
jgi:hypothetical protein